MGEGRRNPSAPALVFGGDKDEWVPVELMRSFVADYKKAGGQEAGTILEPFRLTNRTNKRDGRSAIEQRDGGRDLLFADTQFFGDAQADRLHRS